MAQPTYQYQDMILNIARTEDIPVTVYLTNGFQIRGSVCAFDNYVIIIEADGKQQMLYKHAISTVVPLRNVLESYGGGHN